MSEPPESKTTFESDLSGSIAQAILENDSSCFDEKNYSNARREIEKLNDMLEEIKSLTTRRKSNILYTSTCAVELKIIGYIGSVSKLLRLGARNNSISSESEDLRLLQAAYISCDVDKISSSEDNKSILALATYHVIAASELVPHSAGLKWFEYVKDRWMIYLGFGTALAIFIALTGNVVTQTAAGCLIGDCGLLLGQFTIDFSPDSATRGTAGAVFFILLSIYGIRRRWLSEINGVASNALNHLKNPERRSIKLIIVLFLLGLSFIIFWFAGYSQYFRKINLLLPLLDKLQNNTSLFFAIPVLAIAVTLIKATKNVVTKFKGNSKSISSTSGLILVVISVLALISSAACLTAIVISDENFILPQIKKLISNPYILYLMLPSTVFFASFGLYCIGQAFRIEEYEVRAGHRSEFGRSPGQDESLAPQPSLRSQFHLLFGLCALMVSLNIVFEYVETSKISEFVIEDDSGREKESKTVYGVGMGKLDGRFLILEPCGSTYKILLTESKNVLSISVPQRPTSNSDCR